MKSIHPNDVSRAGPKNCTMSRRGDHMKRTVFAFQITSFYRFPIAQQSNIPIAIQREVWARFGLRAPHIHWRLRVKTAGGPMSQVGPEI